MQLKSTRKHLIYFSAVGLLVSAFLFQHNEYLYIESIAAHAEVIAINDEVKRIQLDKCSDILNRVDFNKSDKQFNISDYLVKDIKFEKHKTTTCEIMSSYPSYIFFFYLFEKPVYSFNFFLK